MRKYRITHRFLSLLICLMTVISMAAQLTVEAEAAYYSGRVRHLFVNGEYVQSGRSEGRNIAFNALITNKMAKGGCKAAFYSYAGQTKNRGTSKTALLNAIKNAYSGSKNSDVGVFYYIGHSSTSGIQINTGEELSHKDLAKALASTSVGKMIVFMDTCHASSFYSNGVQKLSAAQRNKLVVFCASTAKELSLTFAYSKLLACAVQGTNGKYRLADSNKDKKITAQELGQYISAQARNYGLYSTPVYYANDKKTVVYAY